MSPVKDDKPTIPPMVKKIAMSFIRAFLATLFFTLSGLSVFNDWEAARAFAAAALVAALASGFKAAEEALTSDTVKNTLTNLSLLR